DLLLELLKRWDARRVLVFTRTKHRAKRLAEKLDGRGLFVTSLQGNLSQRKRQEALDGFKRGDVHVLVATDIAARGIDVALVSHVVNYDVPDTEEAYVHRIGRTGRAPRRCRSRRSPRASPWPRRRRGWPSGRPARQPTGCRTGRSPCPGARRGGWRGRFAAAPPWPRRQRRAPLTGDLEPLHPDRRAPGRHPGARRLGSGPTETDDDARSRRAVRRFRSVRSRS
ncbi:MAG: helicase-related protein, partial [Candidatus Binatia bacterium]